ncbi:MAG TPA: SPFH domain-containing protein [Pirellulales bacterium]|nr:SPFH domain-containing protein [Pirellulales bacterium]
MKCWFGFGPALLALGMLSSIGCTEQIPQGHVGKVLTASGWKEGVAESGYVACWGRDELYVLAASDASHTEQLNVLCADKLNFRCELVVVSRPKSDEASRDAVFLRVQAEKTGSGPAKINAQQLYDVYVKPVVIPATYDVVSKRCTDQIGEEMAEIRREIIELCRERMSAETPVEVRLIDFTNTDYPEMVTQANEARKKKEIDIEIARSEAAIEEAKAEGRLRAASKEYQAKLLEAKMIVDSNRIIGESLSENPLFLYWHQIKVYGEAAAGPNNVFIVPYEALGGGDRSFLDSPLERASLERAQASAAAAPEIASPAAGAPEQND